MTPWWEIIGRLLLAMLLGGIIGWERERAEKPAGFRTMIIVAMAAAIFVLAAQEAARLAGEVLDNVRAMTGIVGGVGFLGAGIIMRSQGEVRWLTTAASVWASAALGMAAGMGMYLIALTGGTLMIITLCVLPAIETFAHRQPRKSEQQAEKTKKN